MYYVLSKDKKNGTKLSHHLIIDILRKMYLKSSIEIHENRFDGTYIICNLEHEKIYIKLNKSTPEFRPRIIYENIPKNSYIFYMTNNDLNNKIIQKFKLQSLLDI
jgi:hypothetical protein